jgi:phosphopantothenoylcysteine synthetase/decarboxylase
MQTHFGGDHTDVVYIPARLAGDFIVAAYAFREKAVMHELAVPAIFGIITEDESDFEVWNNDDDDDDDDDNDDDDDDDDDDDEFCASLTARLSSQKKKFEN